MKPFTLEAVVYVLGDDRKVLKFSNSPCTVRIVREQCELMGSNPDEVDFGVSLEGNQTIRELLVVTAIGDLISPISSLRVDEKTRVRIPAGELTVIGVVEDQYLNN